MNEQKKSARLSLEYTMPQCIAVDPELADAYLYATGQDGALRELAKNLANYVTIFSAHKPPQWGQPRNIPGAISGLSNSLEINLSPDWARGCLKLQLPDSGYTVTLAAGSSEQQAYERLRHLIAYRVQRSATP